MADRLRHGWRVCAAISVAGPLVAVWLPVRMASARTLPPLCPDGRYLIDAGDPPLLPDTSGGLEAVVIDQGEVSITSGCDPIRAKTYRAARHGTRLVVSWPVCGATRRVRLQAMLLDDCQSMRGMKSIGRARPRRFFALLSTCHDGVVDPGAGEECDGGSGCTADCRRVPVVAPPTSSSTTTTTSSSLSSSTVSPTCADLCGNGVIDPGCGEECDGPGSVTAACPTGARVGCPSCSAGCRVDFSCCPTTTVTSSTSTSRTTSTSSTLPLVSFARDVAPIFAVRCASCHGPPVPVEDMNLATATSAYKALVGVASLECNGVARVASAAPDSSYLLSKLTNVGPCTPTTVMPLGGTPLLASQVSTIRTWIAEGALDN